MFQRHAFMMSYLEGVGLMFCAIDFETQGFNAATDAPTEVGIVAFNDKFEELYSLNFLIKSPLTIPQTQEIIEITNITDEMISGGTPESEVVAQIYTCLKEAKAIFAYNAPFDMSFLNEMLRRNEAPLLDVLVVDVMRDIQYPSRLTCKKLSHLAYDHGIIVNSGELHRAVADVRLMIKLLAKYNLWEAMANAREPKVQLRIKTPAPWIDKQGNEYAKAQGYRFNPDNKFWVKQVRESQVEEIIKGSKYPVEKI